MTGKKNKILLSIIFIVTITFCGSSTTNYITTDREWDINLSKYFDDSIDFLLKPQKLSGEWLTQYMNELKGRIRYSDFIGVVRITGIREDISPEGRKERRVFGEIIKTYKIDKRIIKELKTVEFRTEENLASFEVIEENMRRILNNAFVAYVIWYKDPEKNIIKNHWHLSPATKYVIKLTKKFIKQEIKSKQK